MSQIMSLLACKKIQKTNKYKRKSSALKQRMWKKPAQASQDALSLEKHLPYTV